jgi:hypothetical protein
MLSERRYRLKIMLPGDFPTLANLIFGAGNPLALLFDSSSCSSDSSEESQDTHADNFTYDNFINPLEGLRLPRSCMTYVHDGDMLGNNASTSRDT